MDEEILSAEQKDQVVIATVLLLWFKDSKEATTLAQLYTKNPKKAYEKSDDILLRFRSQALAAPEYGITDKVFLFLEIPGATKDECKAIWEPYFNFAFDVLNIPVTDQRRAFFSGFGFRKFHLCIVAYAIDHTPSFCVHEYHHLLYPGFTGHPFFDEVMTELLAYEKFGYFDRDSLELTDHETLQMQKIDMAYYEYLEVFLSVCRKHTQLFELVESIYKSGDMNRIPEIHALIGKELYTLLERTNPDEYDPKLGKNQLFLSPKEAKEKLKSL